MDTEKMLPYQDFDIDHITLLDFTDEALQVIQSYVEITRHVQEIHQLFELFQYNLKRLLNVYELNNGDRIKRHGPHLGDFSDRIELNALVINYISAGKTLIDSIESCIKSNYLEDRTKYDAFSKFLSSVYGGCFSYRLLTRLRDFAQHGHLPVSVVDDRVCFDIAQIINTPHFNHNKSILKEMKKFNDELLVVERTQPHHVFTLAVAEYTVSMCNVYHQFWLSIQDAFLEKEKEIRTLIEQVPECIIHKNDSLNGWLFYLLDSTLHTFNTAEDSLAMFAENREEAKRIYELEAKELEAFRRSIRMIKLEE